MVGAHGKSPGMKRSTTLQCIRRYGDRKSLDPPRIDPAVLALSSRSYIQCPMSYAWAICRQSSFAADFHQKLQGDLQRHQ